MAILCNLLGVDDAPLCPYRCKSLVPAQTLVTIANVNVLTAGTDAKVAESLLRLRLPKPIVNKHIRRTVLAFGVLWLWGLGRFGL